MTSWPIGPGPPRLFVRGYEARASCDKQSGFEGRIRTDALRALEFRKSRPYLIRTDFTSIAVKQASKNADENRFRLTFRFIWSGDSSIPSLSSRFESSL